MKGNHRYKCKGYNCNCTVDYTKIAAKEIKKRFALSFYLEGIGFHSIGRVLNVSHTIHNEVDKKVRTCPVVHSNSKAVRFMEKDEIHSYAGSKKSINGYGLVLIEMRESMLISP